MAVPRIRAVLLSLAFAAIVATPAIAQEDPSPNGDQCSLEPRTVEEMQAVYGTPAPEGAGEAVSMIQATPVDFELPQGTPADKETAAEIVAAIINLTACHNGGNYLAGLGGVTDEFLVVQVGLSLYDEDFVETMMASPVALDEERQTVILDIREITMLEDGRVSVLFDYLGPSVPGEGINGIETDLFIFENIDGLWLLDEVVENLEGTHGPDDLATPAA